MLPPTLAFLPFIQVSQISLLRFSLLLPNKHKICRFISRLSASESMVSPLLFLFFFCCSRFLNYNIRLFCKNKIRKGPCIYLYVV
ncbi:hypothetical protein ES332_D05G341300v1 [Gossypium tomentosum]|uniref:Uncharacterized protein n=1 Tax=Gossypium tomentosum TaxID=34277 RepID=A0A5D2L3L4_GOSTO|nr:hypothetical protein ES332_D05G341300v1 [Gossypium tomentosum]